VSTPDQGKTFQNLASAASSGAVIATKEVGKPDCNVTPLLVGYEHSPTWADLKEFGEIKVTQ
jgi:hypothetical protein